MRAARPRENVPPKDSPREMMRATQMQRARLRRIRRCTGVKVMRDVRLSFEVARNPNLSRRGWTKGEGQ